MRVFAAVLLAAGAVRARPLDLVGIISAPLEALSKLPLPGLGPTETGPYSTEPTGSPGPVGPGGAVRFPWSAGNADRVVPITPGAKNAGWAMSPDQQCTAGSWCPYACEPGYYAAQWDPQALVYNGKGSMNGGLFAEADGRLTKPFPERPYCAPGMFNARIRNTLGQPVSACQTVYPGNEAMLIPSVAAPGGSVPLNVVPSSYWLGTSAQYYVNMAGSGSEQCVWGNPGKPTGNWGPFIFGAGQGKDGNTYISVQYNPLYLEVGFKAQDAYNVRIECDSGHCNFPAGGECKCEKGKCSVDNGCTVTLGPNGQASFVIY
ncbi:hypothetical protein H4R18_003687 [Coemansia javaensis]|uniref:Uncharacterized protein n=1 Tax=Coemansia javaensis TaxID=2761396 RepID=A0A9W8LGX7_9FUNG|nr:hypothetical protein H4R18_003687 [Coemansia javaensis]